MIYVTATTEAVDAALITKDLALIRYAQTKAIPRSRIGAIGDGVNDLPFLLVEGLRVAAAPANAHQVVKDAVRRLPHGLVTDGHVLAGFLEFYRYATAMGVSHVFADRDGVLWTEGQAGTHLDSLRSVFSAVGGAAAPTVLILTGTSAEQNIPFLEATGLTTLSQNAAIREDPRILLAENGAVKVDVLSGKTHVDLPIDDDLLAELQGPVREEVVRRLHTEVLPEFRLSFCDDADSQIERVYLPAKKTMLTINVPRRFSDGRSYRKSEEGTKFRRRVVEVVVETLRVRGLQHSVRQ